MNSKKTAIVIGATGLVGSNLVSALLDNPMYGEVKIFVRKTLDLVHDKLRVHVVDFDYPKSFENEVFGDVLYSCMGTTLKTAGSKDAQYKVDYTYQYEMAESAKRNNVSQMVLVSATGASAKSMVFYSRIKGELEENIKKLNFESTIIVRPSVLIGKRAEKRMGETLSIGVIGFMSKLIPPLKKYRGIKGEEVALAMLNLSIGGAEKFLIVELDELFKFSAIKK